MSLRAVALIAVVAATAGAGPVASQIVPTPTVTISTSRSSVPENPDQVTGSTTLSTSPTSGPTFTVRIDTALPVDVTLPYSVAGSAIAGRDYQTLSGQVTIPAGRTSATITVSPIDDSEAEADETVVVTIDSRSTSPYTVGRPGSGTTTIVDDDATPPGVESLRFRGAILLGGESTSGEVRLTAPAPAGGLTIPITLSSPGVSASKIPASAPASVTIAAGGLYGVFDVETQAVTTSTEVHVAAGSAPTSASARIELHPVPRVESIVAVPELVGSEDSVTVRVYLDRQYLGANNWGIELAGSGPVVVPPFTVASFRRYDQDARVRLGTESVADTTVAEVFLRQSGFNVSNEVARFRVAPPPVTSVRFRAALIAGGETTTGEVHLDAPAPAAGLTVPITLSSSTGGPVPATAPASVTFAPGMDRASFDVESQPVVSSAPVPVVIAVGHPSGASAGTIEIAQVPDVQAVIVGPDPVEGGDTVAVRIQLDVRNWLVSTLAFRVTGSGPVDVPPNSVIRVQYGSDSGRLRLGTRAVTTATTATIGVSLDPTQPGQWSRTFSVEPEPATPTITALSPSPVNPIGSAEVQLTVSLSHPADAGGFTATLSSTDPSIVPGPTVRVAEGQQTGSIRVRTAAVPVERSVRLGVPGSPAADIVVRPIPLDRIQTPGSVRGGDVVNAEIRLSEAAPAGGLRVPLKTSDAMLAAVPAFVEIPAGAISATVAIQTRAGQADTRVTITAGFGPGAVAREFRIRSQADPPLSPATGTTSPRF